MQVKSIAECSKGSILQYFWRLEHSAILLTFIKLPFVIKIFVLSIFKWKFYTGFTVYALANRLNQDQAALLGAVWRWLNLFAIPLLHFDNSSKRKKQFSQWIPLQRISYLYEAVNGRSLATVQIWFDLWLDLANK